MKQCIIRVAKIKTKGVAQGKTKHNYRLMDTPNADPERTKHLNEEYLNHDQRDYWSLAEERIGEAVKRKVRDDQVRAMEVLLTASPDWFKKDANGQAQDMRGSKWVNDNLHFLQERFGAKNVVSFTLHQDEKTPHIHAVIVPITETGRLSADTLFNPKTLRQLQTDYAEAMAEHGLERGVEGSRRTHQDMKQVYGRQETTASELAPLVEATSVKPFTLEMPPLLGREAWKEAQEAKINAEIERQVAEVSKRLQEVGSVAVAQAGAKEQAQILDEQLRKSEGQKQRNYQVATRLQQELEEARTKLAQFAVDLVQGNRPSFEAIKLGHQAVAEAKQRVEVATQEVLRKPFLTREAMIGHFEAQGFRVETHQGKYGPELRVEEIKTGLQHPLKQFIPDWEAVVAERVRQDAQEKEQARRIALAQHPHSKNAELEGDLKILTPIRAELERAGVNIWYERERGDYGYIKMSYHLNHGTIEAIDQALASASRLGIQVSENKEDHAFRRQVISAIGTPLGQELKAKAQGLGYKQNRDQSHGIG